MDEELDAHTIRAWGERFSNWGRWGGDDRRGTLNFITRERVVAACAIPQSGQTVSCTLPDAPESRTGWDRLDSISYDGRMYNGRTFDAASQGERQAVAVDPLRDAVVGRGVLLDLPRLTRKPWLEDRTRIRSRDLDTCAEAFGVTIEPGDIALIRTGMLARCRQEKTWKGYLDGPAPGLSIDCTRWIYEREIAALAADTSGVEVRPHEIPDCPQPFHLIAQRDTGLLIGRNFDLDALSGACADDGRYEFFFVAAPLPTAGASGVLTHPLAIK
jgi:kynurenine formamidase